MNKKRYWLKGGIITLAVAAVILVVLSSLNSYIDSRINQIIQKHVVAGDIKELDNTSDNDSYNTLNENRRTVNIFYKPLFYPPILFTFVANRTVLHICKWTFDSPCVSLRKFVIKNILPISSFIIVYFIPGAIIGCFYGKLKKSKQHE